MEEQQIIRFLCKQMFLHRNLSKEKQPGGRATRAAFLITANKELYNSGHKSLFLPDE